MSAGLPTCRDVRKLNASADPTALKPRTKHFPSTPRIKNGCNRLYSYTSRLNAQFHMGLFDIFKHKTKIKGAGATLYPDKIVIETVDRISNSYGVTSSNVTILKADVDSVTLGQTLRRHLDQSRDNLKTTETGDYKDYLKAAGFKRRKEHYKNATHLTVDKRNDKISLNPTINGGPTGKDRGFLETKETIILTLLCHN